MDTRTKVARLTAEGKTCREIATLLGISKSTVSYHRRRLHLPMDSKCARRYNWSAVQAYYDKGYSKRECQKKFGFASETWSKAVRRGAIVPRPHTMPLDELLRRGRRRGRNHVKLRLFAAGLKESRCEECGISEWRDKPLSIALHHINGDGRDNRLENLALLCPNCHSQTPNFAAKKYARANVEAA